MEKNLFRTLIITVTNTIAHFLTKIKIWNVENIK